MARGTDSGDHPPGPAGTHLRLFGVKKQDSGNILAGPKNVLHELPASGAVQVVLGLLGIVLDGH